MSPLAHMTVAMASCPCVSLIPGDSRRICLFRLALSASAPGDFRPVRCDQQVNTLLQDCLALNRSGPLHCALPVELLVALRISWCMRCCLPRSFVILHQALSLFAHKVSERTNSPGYSRQLESSKLLGGVKKNRLACKQF